MSGEAGSTQAAFCATLVDEWTRAGLRHAVCSPGSRSTPVLLALADAAEAGLLRLHVRLDERSAGFFAIGLARASGAPVLVVTTSGTAAAELAPAVAEAGAAGVPLVVLSADRPASLHGVGAPQTMDQGGLFSAFVRWELSVEAAAQGRWSWRSLASRAYCEAVEHPAGPGPVHLNIGLEEPLVAEPAELPPARVGRLPWQRVARSEPPAPPGAAEALAARRGVVLAGESCGPQAEVFRLADSLGWPVLADPLSGARSEGSIAAVEPILAAAGSERLRPEVVLRLGRPWASRRVSAWLASLPEVILAEPRWRFSDPERNASIVLSCGASALADALAGAAPVEPGWIEAWRGAEEAAQLAFDKALGSLVAPEPALARAAWDRLGATDVLVVASSMPVRDLEAFAAPRAGAPRAVANRGVNGIDGTVSTAAGVAAARRGGPGRTWLVVGDLAFLHDASALLASTEVGVGPGGRAGLEIVVVDNGGGGIFSFLAQAEKLPSERFELLFGTPQAADVLEVAAAYGAEVAEASSPEQIFGAEPAAAVRVWRVRSDRAANLVAHRELLAVAASAVDERLRSAG